MSQPSSQAPTAGRIAVTGATGLIGRAVVEALIAKGYSVVATSRRAESLGGRGAQVEWRSANVASGECLRQAFEGCDAVIHLAGINREIGEQTYAAVHVDGTRHVAAAARAAGVAHLTAVSFLRARPDCGSAYHESKWAAEELIRNSGLRYTILKPGVIFGPGDHLLDHLSHALHTFPVFGLVGFSYSPIAPVAVEDIARVLVDSIGDRRLWNATFSAIGPETMALDEAVRRVARAIGRRPLYVKLPLTAHHILAWVAERTMKVPLVSLAQVRILSEGVVEPLPFAEPLPEDLRPSRRFDEAGISAGLPEPGPFGLSDLQCVPPARLANLFSWS